MLKFVIHKLLFGFSVLFGVVTLLFCLFILFPSAEEITAGQRSDAATKEAMRKEMGLDKSKGIQFLYYINDLSPVSFHNNSSNLDDYNGLRIKAGSNTVMLKTPYLRKSYQNKREVTSILSDAFKGTFVLAVAAIVIAMLLGIVFGIIAALKQGTLIDNLALLISTTGISVPSFFSAVIISWLFGFVWHSYTGLSMTGSLYELDPSTGSMHINFANIILPAIALGIRPFAIITQLSRSSMIEVMQQDYIRTAKAKGLSATGIVMKHALRNALNPVITAVSGWFASLLAGAFFVEFVFNWKGLGKVTIEALQQSDLPVVMGAVLLISVIFILMNILVDVLYTFLDPRVKLSA
ncbi:MAG: ABC transporter permease [Bacteroidia bacterium]|nr:ABC transporter permease [Bacteroidia bacterium]